ncbi:conserved hypothetical protein [Ricinus communis]|uniref:Uncharacterized protein n=1 Tax=Ricinus communis TaxID=3988 RepID=B9RE47_RICCO|nr:conserved hypothetical protein [Ricinus communis]
MTLSLSISTIFSSKFVRNRVIHDHIQCKISATSEYLFNAFWNNVMQMPDGPSQRTRDSRGPQTRIKRTEKASDYAFDLGHALILPQKNF